MLSWREAGKAGAMPYVSNEGVRIWYEVAGSGPPLLLLHCNPFDHRVWLYQIAAYSDRFRVIAPDLRGYGRTDKVIDPYGLDDLAADILAVIEVEQARDIVLVGVSIWAVLTLKLGHDRPDLFRALVAVGASAPAKDRGPDDPRVRGYRELGAKGYYRRHMEETVSPGFAASAIGRYMLDMFAASTGDLEGEAIVKILQARAPVDLTPLLPAIHRPLLVVNGVFDAALREGRRTAALVPAARHVTLADAGHACCMENPVGFNAAMDAFLDEHCLVPFRF
jgi:pimeloyl-ACP methyl ester carboxylesterase